MAASSRHHDINCYKRCCSHLLHGEDLMVEVLLKLLVGQVDTQLLEAVLVKVLKTKNIQNSCR